MDKAFASTTGWRTTGREIVVATVMSPAADSTAASAVGPSSQGRRHTRWSLAARVVYPSCRAADA